MAGETHAGRDGIVIGADGRGRCFWHEDLPNHPEYHDREWGRPVHDSRRLFEKICLEGFQSGLSWRTIMEKRENFRRAFHDFDFARVARFDAADIARLLADSGIVRHRGKIEAVVNNARRASALEQEGENLAAFLWGFAPAPEERPARVDLAYLHGNPSTAASKRLSKALKSRGWRFVGPTTMHAFMQATGMVNDHLEGCFCRAEIEAASAAGR